LVLRTQPRSIRRFGRRFGSHPRDSRLLFPQEVLLESCRSPIRGLPAYGRPRWETSTRGTRMQALKRTRFMEPNQDVRKSESLLRKTTLLGLLAMCAGLSAIQRTEAAPNVVVWDTRSPLGDPADVESRAGWNSVP